jgi:Tfp pilus assembly protein PilF
MRLCGTDPFTFTGFLVHLLQLLVIATPNAVAEPNLTPTPPSALTSNWPSKNPGSTSDFAIQRATPSYFSLPPIQDYSESALAEAFRRKLSPEELKLVINPLLSSPDIDRWAQQLTAKATNDETKAKILFETLASKARENSQLTEGAMRTAREVFAAWNRSDARFYCQDYTFLYVALARAVGVRAYAVCVQEEVDGGKAQHACAAIILGDKSLLVDPSYYWFGAPHKQFKVLNDLEETALFMGQLSSLKCAEIAVKLDPNLPLVQLNLFEDLVAVGRLTEAQNVLAQIKRSETNAAVINYAEGCLALRENKPEVAIDLLLKAIAINPNEATYHEQIAKAYVEVGRVTEAIGSFKDALRCPITGTDAARIKSYVMQTNVLAAFGSCCLASKMQREGDLDGALRNYDKAIELQPDYADAYYYRASVKQAKGDGQGASDDYKQAIHLKPELGSAVPPTSVVRPNVTNTEGHATGGAR